MAKVKIQGFKRFEVLRKEANKDTYFKQPFVISFIPNNFATFEFLSYVLKQEGINEIEYKDKSGVEEYKISDVVLVKRETYIDMFFELEKIIICKIKRKHKYGSKGEKIKSKLEKYILNDMADDIRNKLKELGAK